MRNVMQNMSVLLPIVLFISWFLFTITPAGKLALEDEINGVPPDKRRGTSIFPGFPVVPLVLWGVARLIDQVMSPWGTNSFLLVHLVLLSISVFIITRDVLRLREIRKTNA